MGPIPGASYGGKKKVQAAKKSKSGNPAKRAAENAAIASGGQAAGAAASGSGFGLGGAKGSGKAGAPSEEELAALQKFMGRR
jgi:signal recognition particle subunit SRP54